MKKLRKLNFVELTRSELKNVVGGDTDPRPYSTSSPTLFVGTTYHGDGSQTNDNNSDTETIQDYQSDYA